MAIFSIDIADDQVDRVIAAICANYNFQTQIANPDFDEDDDNSPTMIDNPETTLQFANRMVREYLINNTQAYEVQLAKQQALDNVVSDLAITNPTD